MRVSALIPQCEGKVEFSRSRLARVPESPGCYALSNHPGDILYVGQATSLRERMDEHLKDPEKTGETKLGAAFWFHYVIAPPSRLRAIEIGWYHQQESAEGRSPPLNKRSPPRP